VLSSSVLLRVESQVFPPYFSVIGRPYVAILVRGYLPLVSYSLRRLFLGVSLRPFCAGRFWACKIQLDPYIYFFSLEFFDQKILSTTDPSFMPVMGTYAKFHDHQHLQTLGTGGFFLVRHFWGDLEVHNGHVYRDVTKARGTALHTNGDPKT